MGVGSTILEEEFLGDSQYFSVLHDVGIIGGIIVVTYLLKQFVIAYRKRNIAVAILMALTIVMSIAGTTIFGNGGIVLLAFVELSNCKMKRPAASCGELNLLLD